MNRCLTAVGFVAALVLVACEPAPQAQSRSDVVSKAPPALPSTPAASQIPLEHAQPLDLGNGIKVRLDEPYALFVAEHAGWTCFDFDNTRICETTSPSLIDCPGAMPCDHVAATFRTDRMIGISASYRENGYWGELLSRTMRLSPANYVVLPNIGNLQTRAWRWVSEKGNLTFVLSDGFAANGDRIALPFSILFGPDLYAPQQSGTIVSPMYASEEGREEPDVVGDFLKKVPETLSEPAG